MGSRIQSLNELEIKDEIHQKEEAKQKDVIQIDKKGVESYSRIEIVGQLEDLGVNAGGLAALSIDNLTDLLRGIRVIIDANLQHGKPGRPRNAADSVPVLTSVDKKMLEALFASEGYISSLALSRKVDVPLSTVQRRRKRLEDTLIDRNYSLKVERFGFRRATLLVSINAGSPDRIGQSILDEEDMVESAHRMLGESKIDLRLEAIIRTNAELMSLIDRVKAVEGVKDVFWSESIALIGRNPATSKRIMESL